MRMENPSDFYVGVDGGGTLAQLVPGAGKRLSRTEAKTVVGADVEVESVRRCTSRQTPRLRGG